MQSAMLRRPVFIRPYVYAPARQPAQPAVIFLSCRGRERRIAAVDANRSRSKIEIVRRKVHQAGTGEQAVLVVAKRLPLRERRVALACRNEFQIRRTTLFGEVQ